VRDPQRIDRIVDKLREVWKQHPDQRLGQLVCNLLGNEAWIPEDDELERLLDMTLTVNRIAERLPFGRRRPRP
jgi:hypothetical protein